VTLQTDHADSAKHHVDDCVDMHGEVHTSPGG
jgi:hypothetical protein